MKKYTIEFIGTFFLALAVALTGNPIAIGAVLATMVYMGGYISGAHYNPAVTIAVWMQKKISAKDVVAYIVTQFIAVIAAAGVFQLIKSDTVAVMPANNTEFITALLVELLFTFALVSVILHTAASKATKGNDYYGLAIGLVLGVAALAGGSISGGAFNPAIGIGFNLYDWNALMSSANTFWLYLVGPIAGGVIASLVFTFTTKQQKAAIKHESA